MSIGTATAIAIGVGAASSIASAKIQSNAAKKAAETQSAAGDKSLAFQEKQFNAQRAAFEPYRQTGVSAASSLDRMMQPGGQLSQGFTQDFVAPGQAKPTYSLSSMMQPQAMAPGGPPAGVSTGGPVARAQMPAPQQPAAQPGGEMWTIKSPTGQTQQFPAAIAQHYIQQGAVRVG